MNGTESEFDTFEDQLSNAQVSDLADDTTSSPSPISNEAEEIDIPSVGLSAEIGADDIDFGDVEPPIVEETADNLTAEPSDEFVPTVSSLEEEHDVSLEAALQHIDMIVEPDTVPENSSQDTPEQSAPVDLAAFRYTALIPSPSPSQDSATVIREGSDVESANTQIRVSSSTGEPRLIVKFQDETSGKLLTRSTKVNSDLPAAYAALAKRLANKNGQALPDYSLMAESLEREYSNARNDLLAHKLADTRSLINMQIRAVDSDLASVINGLEQGRIPANKMSIERFAAPKRNAFELNAPVVVTNPETGKPESLPKGTLIAATSSASRVSIIPPGSGLAKSMRALDDLQSKEFTTLGTKVHKPLRLALAKIASVAPDEVAAAAQTLSMTSEAARARGMSSGDDVLKETNEQTAKEHDEASAADELKRAEYQKELEEYEAEQERLKAQGRSSKGGALAGLFQQSSGKKPMPPTSLYKEAVDARIKAANESGLAAALTFDHAAENYERASTQYAEALRRRGLANETPDSDALASYLSTREGKRVATDLSQANAIIQQTFSPEAISKQGQKLMETTGATVQSHYQEKLAEAATRISAADKNTADVPKLDGGALKELQESLSELTEKIAELFKSLNPLRKT